MERFRIADFGFRISENSKNDFGLRISEMGETISDWGFWISENRRNDFGLRKTQDDFGCRIADFERSWLRNRKSEIAC